MKTTIITFAALGLLASLAAPSFGQGPANGAGLDGIYAGSYLCQDGEHGFYLDIAALAPNDQGGFSASGVLGFFPVLGGTDGPLAEVAGSFTVSGTIEGDGRITLAAGEWLVEPAGYGAAELEGRLTARADGLWEIAGRPVIPGNADYCSGLVATQFLP